MFKEGYPVKILAAFFLSGFFLFFPAAGVVPLWAQHYRGMIPNSYQELRTYDRIGIKSDEQNAIENLEKSNNDLNEKLQHLEITNDTHELEIRNLEYDLKQAKADLDTAKAYLDAAKVRIDVLEHIGAAWDRLFSAQMGRRPPSQPKAPVNKPKVTLDFSKAQPIEASKPTAPINKPKPTVDSPKDR
jgi:septal ring factor EnvC (AmiA/AmiB activator)